MNSSEEPLIPHDPVTLPEEGKTIFSPIEGDESFLYAFLKVRVTKKSLFNKTAGRQR
jgi:hypothetical protein